MIALMIAGALSYYRLGRNEDPAFTFRTMVVQAAWPGATLNETLDQVTERIERTLQETPNLDFLTQLHQRRRHHHLRDPEGQHAGRRGPRHLVSRPQERRRHAPHPAGGRRRPRLQRRVRRHLRDHLRLHRRRFHPPRAARLRRGHPLTAAAGGDVSKIEILGAQDEKIIIEFSTEKLAGLGIDRGDVIAALRAQNAVSPAGILQTGDERLALRVSGAFDSELDILAINIAFNGRLIRLGDIAEVRRVYVDPPQPIFRVNGKPAIGVAIAMRDGGDILTLGRNMQRTMDEITADLPLGIEPVLVADQSSVVRTPSASS